MPNEPNNKERVSPVVLLADKPVPSFHIDELNLESFSRRVPPTSRTCPNLSPDSLIRSDNAIGKSDYVALDLIE